MQTQPQHGRDTGSAADSSPAHLDIPDRVGYFFRDGYTCRLCGVLHGTPRMHFIEGVEARHHVVSEILASCMADGERRGIEAAQMRASWLTALPGRRTVQLPLSQADGITIGQATNGQPPPTHAQLMASLKRRALAAQRAVLALRDMEVLRSSLAPARRLVASDKAETKRARNTAGFERREYVGDSMWGDQCSRRFFVLFPFRDWLAPAHAWAWGMLRDGVETNDNLTRLFDLMELGAALPPDVVLGGDKPKADILEAIMGDAWLFLATTEHPLVGAASAAGVVCPLAPAYPAGTAMAAAAVVARWLLDEIVDLLTLSFLLHFATDACIALAQDVVVRAHWAPFAPALRQASEPPLSGRRLRRALHGPAFTFRKLLLDAMPTHLPPPSSPLRHASAEAPVSRAQFGAWARVIVDPATNEHRPVHERSGTLGSRSALAVEPTSVRRRIDLTLPRVMQPAASAALVPEAPLIPSLAPAVSAVVRASGQVREPGSVWGLVGDMQPPLQPAPPVDESRVHSAPFLINSGIIPQVVLDADARRQAAAALRKKKRR